MNRWLSGFFILLMAALFVEILILSPQDLDESVVEPEDLKATANKFRKQPSQVMNGVHLVESQEGKREWELWADKAINYQTQKAWSLETVHIRFYSTEGHFFDVTGERSTVEMRSRNIVIEGNVLTRSSNGYEMRTTTATYNSLKRQLVCPEKVYMLGIGEKRQKTLDLQGDSLFADVNTQKIIIEKNVRAKKRIKDAEMAVISSDKAEFSGISNYTKFEGRVTIDARGYRITGPSALLQHKGKSHEVENLIVEGGVRVSDFEKWATSERLHVNFDKDALTFQGSPKVVQSHDELSGEEIILSEGGKRVKVIKARARMRQEQVEKTGENL